MSASIRLGIRFVLLTALLFVCFAVGSVVAGITANADPATAQRSASALLFVCLAITVVLSYPILRSRWYGWRLVLTVFWAIFGIVTVLTQIETIVFLRQLVDIISPELVPKLFIQGAVVALLFAPLLVLVLGKMRTPDSQASQANSRLVMPAAEWVWKLAAIAVVYVFVYLLFGLVVFRPLAGAAFDEYYKDLQMPAWILPFQALRGLVWATIAIPIIRMMRGPMWEAALAVALVFSVLMGFQLLLPGDIMPAAIRLSHFVEVTSSNFVFGWLLVWILSRKGRLEDRY